MKHSTIEDYLKAIYKITQQGDRVTTSRIAKALGVRAPTVTAALKKLGKMRLIRHRAYQGVELLAAGEKIALEVIRHHRLLELYLQQALGYSWDRVHQEAEILEHHISEDFEERIFQALGCPEFDPHGDPIPSKNGEVPASRGLPLSTLAAGQSVVIERVDDTDPQLLRYLEQIGLRPKVKIQILRKSPFDGPTTLGFESNREEIVGTTILEKVYGTVFHVT